MIAVGIVKVFKFLNLVFCICTEEWLMNGQLHAVWASGVNASGMRMRPTDCAWVVNCMDNCMLHVVWASRVMQVELECDLLIVH